MIKLYFMLLATELINRAANVIDRANNMAVKLKTKFCRNGSRKPLIKNMDEKFGFCVQTLFHSTPEIEHEPWSLRMQN